MKLLTKLEATSSHYAKAQLLRTASELELKVFQYAFDPYKTYGVTSFGTIPMDSDEPTEDMFTLLDMLATRKISGNLARDMIEKYAKNNGSLIKHICRKKLLCGVQAKTVNRLYPGLIPEFNVQLAKELKPDELKKLTYPILAQLKYDGVRLIVICKNRGDVELRTRNGLLVNSPELANVFSKFSNIIFDGEIVAGSGKVKDRTNISGLVNSAIHGGELKMENISYHVFDTMGLQEWLTNRCDFKYNERYEELKNLLQDYYLKGVHIADSFVINSYNELMEKYNNLLKAGYEGLILKSQKHKYTFKRSKDWIKLKDIRSTELKCISIKEGEDKYTGQIGALTCEGFVDGLKIKVDVGTGLTDFDRSCSHSKYIGKKINIDFNTIIQNSVTKEYSLFLPRYMGIREDV